MGRSTSSLQLVDGQQRERLTRWKAASSWWVGLVPRRGGSQEPSKLSSCFCFGADPIDGHLFVVGQDQYPSMGRFRKPPLVAMGSRILLVARRENVHSFSVD
ncbi:hypothetical protein XU18_1445 [Perkinsela sp. CCAP 1560/4]|nr:hypothetical protein XU18_1445 [Perkinsela sp. CCAP 1560/4]|eukprot:KNH07966.1 hypothetical protein XU18_1445 [Perkinsela sp. CCAP 1560/4]